MPRLLPLVFALAALAIAAPAQAVPPFSTLWGVTPNVDPPGVNPASCTLTAAHPEPILLLHGTWMDRSISWNVIGPKLALDGYCVYSIDYGKRATQSIEQSAKDVSAKIDDLLAKTGASRLSIVGHSQGGMMPRWIIKFLGAIRRSTTSWRSLRQTTARRRAP